MRYLWLSLFFCTYVSEVSASTKEMAFRLKNEKMRTSKFLSSDEKEGIIFLVVEFHDKIG